MSLYHHRQLKLDMVGNSIQTHGVSQYLQFILYDLVSGMQKHLQ